MGLDVAKISMGTDLSLDLKMFVARSMGRVKDAPVSSMDDCICRLEDERGKIKVFRRELPLCVRLLADVIDVVKEEAKKKKGDREEDGGTDGKSKWMSITHLWTGNSGRDDTDSEKQDKERSLSEVNSHGGGAFMPFKAVGSSALAFVPPCFRKDDKAYDVGMLDLSLLLSTPTKSTPAAATAAADEIRRQVVGFAQAAARATAMAPSGPNLILQTRSQQQHVRKARRCWSPELHRQFVAALQQLGGCGLLCLHLHVHTGASSIVFNGAKLGGVIVHTKF